MASSAIPTDDLGCMDGARVTASGPRIKTCFSPSVETLLEHGALSRSVHRAQRKQETLSWPRSVSVGEPFQGALVYPARLDSDHTLYARKGKNYGTSELVNLIRRATHAVHRAFPGSPALHVGDLSRKRGGPFPPHVSHQSGRDVDIGYYVRRGHNPKWFQRIRGHNLDVKRTWVLMESFLRSGRIEYMFSHRRLIPSLYRYARKQTHITGDELVLWFGGGVDGKPGLIRHLKGHDDHLHIRVFTPESVAAIGIYEKMYGRKALRNLVKRVPRRAKIRRGDSLYRIAKRYRIAPRKLRSWNRLRGRSPRLIAGRRLIVGYVHPWDSHPPPHLAQVASKKRRALRRKSAQKRRSAGRAQVRAPRARSAIRRRPARRVHRVMHATRTAKAVKRSSTSRRAKPKRSLRTRASKRRSKVLKYTVRSGDSLMSIARQFGVSSSAICRANRLQRDCRWKALRRRASTLQLGQKLRIRTRG